MDVYCRRTKRIRKSVDVKFLDTPPIDDEEAPDVVDFSLSSVAPTPITAKSPVGDIKQHKHQNI